MFSENDMLYILGYVVDRGPEPVEVLLDMMKRKNVIFVLGNHDYLMYAVMKKVLNSLKNNINLTEEERALYKLWIEYGGVAV